MSTELTAPTTESLYALDNLTEVQQEMLETLLSRFGSGEGDSTSPAGPVGMDVDDEGYSPLQLPVIKIKQKMTSDPGCPEEAKEGDFYTTSGDLLSSPLTIVPVALWKSHIKWEEGGGRDIECQSPDAKLGSINLLCKDCPDLPWRNNEKQACGNVMNAIVLTDTLSLYTVRFAGSSFKTGRTLGRFLRSQSALWVRQFKLTSEARKNNKGSFYVSDIAASAAAPSDDVQKVAKYVTLQLAKARKDHLTEFYARTRGELETVQIEKGADSGTPAITVEAKVSDADEPDFGEM